MQKTVMQVLLSISFLILVLSGCEQISSEPPNNTSFFISSTPSAAETSLSDSHNSPSPSSSPEPSFMIVKERWQVFEDSSEYDIGNKTYFLATHKLLTNGKETGYMLYCLDRSSGAEKPVNILAYDIGAFGEHLYLLIYNGMKASFPVQSSEINTLYRLEINGSITPICGGYGYYDVEEVLRRIDDNLYFTRYDENAIYEADLNCEEIKPISIILPEENDPMEYSKITASGELFVNLEIVSVENGFIFFTYVIFNESGEEHFRGYYKISATDNHIEKIYSAFYDCRTVVGQWLYYVDLEHPIYSEYQEEALYQLHRMKIDGSGDENLKLQCFRFDVAGRFLYADTDLWYGDFAHWSTLRYNHDGTGQKQLDYYNMVRYSEGNRLYFTQFDENDIYIADTACNELMKIEISIPDDSNLHTKIGNGYEFGFITVIDQQDDWLTFEYRVTDTGPFTFYKGLYQVNLKSSKIVKVDEGEFFTP